MLFLTSINLLPTIHLMRKITWPTYPTICIPCLSLLSPSWRVKFYKIAVLGMTISTSLWLRSLKIRVVSSNLLSKCLLTTLPNKTKQKTMIQLTGLIKIPNNFTTFWGPHRNLCMPKVCFIPCQMHLMQKLRFKCAITQFQNSIANPVNKYKDF